MTVAEAIIFFVVTARSEMNERQGALPLIPCYNNTHRKRISYSLTVSPNASKKIIEGFRLIRLGFVNSDDDHGQVSFFVMTHHVILGKL